MQIDYARSFRVLVDAGEYVELKRLSNEERKVDLVFFREINDITQKEALVARKKSSLTFFQKVQFFFRIGNFSLRTVSRLTDNILEKKKNISDWTKKHTDQSYFLLECLKFINGKISHANEPKRIFGVFQRHRTTINGKFLDATIKSIDDSIKGSFKQISRPATNVVPAPAQKIENGGLTSPMRRGIENPGCLCYCNSTIKALLASEELRKAIWEDKEGLTATYCLLLKRIQEGLRTKNVLLTTEEWGKVYEMNPWLEAQLSYFSHNDTKRLSEQIKGARESAANFFQGLKNAALEPIRMKEIVDDLVQHTYRHLMGKMGSAAQTRVEIERLIKLFETMDEGLQTGKTISLSREEWELLYKYRPTFKNAFEYFSEKEPTKLLQLIDNEIIKANAQKGVRKSIGEVFEALQRKGEAPLQHDEEPMLSLIKHLTVLFPELEKKSKQQDQQEFLLPILEALMPPEGRLGVKLFSEKIREGDECAQKEIVGKLQGLLTKPDEELLKGKQDLLDKVTALVPIDTNRTETPSSMVLFHPTDDLIQHIKDVFFDVREREVPVANLLETLPELSPDEKRKLTKLIGKESVTVPYSETVSLIDPPKVLPIYVARFTPDGKKNTNSIVAPDKLSIPVQGTGKDVSYELKSIVCHAGVLTGGHSSGHYYTYVPLKTASGEVLWVRHSDSIVSEPVKWASIADTVSEEATLYMYDQIS